MIDGVTRRENVSSVAREIDSNARPTRAWFTHDDIASATDKLDRHAFSGGAVITYPLAWEEGGAPHAARHCHVLRFDGDGLIADDRFFCGGRWDAALLAEMAADQG